jgi:hypothetical protein
MMKNTGWIGETKKTPKEKKKLIFFGVSALPSWRARTLQMMS